MRHGIKLGGVTTAARIINRVKVAEADHVLSDLKDLDKYLATRVVDEMTRFEELIGANTRSLQGLIRELDAGALITALTGAPKLVRDAFLHSMSRRARARFLDDLESAGPTRRSDIEDARKDVVRCARRLSEENRFVLPSEGYIR